MTIEKKKEGTTLCVALTGRLDTVTSGELDACLEAEKGFTDLILDFAALDYLSSSGLRLLFSQQRALGGKQHVILRNVNAVVREILRVTGFERQVTIE